MNKCMCVCVWVCVYIYTYICMYILYTLPVLSSVSVFFLPANRGFTRLGRTTVITSTLSHKQMAKQMILAHLTQDHPYLFHGCWPTDSLCPSLLHERSGREMAADTHARTHIHTNICAHALFQKQSGHEKGSECEKKKRG